MVFVLVGGGYVAGTLVVWAWCRFQARAEAEARRARLVADGLARAEWWASASEIDRLDQVFTGSAPWRARSVR